MIFWWLLLSIIILCVKSQFHPHHRPTVSPNVNTTTSGPTPEPTQKIYPCDYIDPVINASNCGICVMNDSCA